MNDTTILSIVLRCPECRAYLGRRNYVTAQNQREEVKCQRCRKFVEPKETKN